jgi:hypothetical protein
MRQTGLQTIQNILHRQDGDAALCIMSDKFRAYRFCITSLHSVDQNNDDDNEDDDNDDNDNDEVNRVQ